MWHFHVLFLQCQRQRHLNSIQLLGQEKHIIQLSLDAFSVTYKMKIWWPVDKAVGFFSLIYVSDLVWLPPAVKRDPFLILPQIVQTWCKGHWKLQQPGLQWWIHLGWIGATSEMNSWMSGSASASMSTQVYRAGGNSSTCNHLNLAMTDASTQPGTHLQPSEGKGITQGPLIACQIVILQQAEWITFRKCFCLRGLLTQMTSQMTNLKQTPQS